MSTGLIVSLDRAQMVDKVNTEADLSLNIRQPRTSSNPDEVEDDR